MYVPRTPPPAVQFVFIISWTWARTWGNVFCIWAINGGGGMNVGRPLLPSCRRATLMQMKSVCLWIGWLGRWWWGGACFLAAPSTGCVVGDPLLPSSCSRIGGEVGRREWRGGGGDWASATTLYIRGRLSGPALLISPSAVGGVTASHTRQGTDDSRPRGARRLTGPGRPPIPEILAEPTTTTSPHSAPVKSIATYNSLPQQSAGRPRSATCRSLPHELINISPDNLSITLLFKLIFIYFVVSEIA